MGLCESHALNQNASVLAGVGVSFCSQKLGRDRISLKEYHESPRKGTVTSLVLCFPAHPWGHFACIACRIIFGEVTSQ